MIPISQELVTWAAVGSFAFTPDDQSGAAVFSSDPGAEIRMYVRHSHDGYVLTWAERRSTEQFELFTPVLQTMERYLFGQFGSNFRSLNGLERLRIPTRPESIAPGYSLSVLDAKGRCTLFDREANVLAVADGDITAVSALVKLSHLLSSSVDKLTASYRNPCRPLFGEPDLRASASTAFADKVKTIIGPSLTPRGFTFDRVLELDEGGRIGLAAFFRNTICKVQVYWSARERELNCMIAANSAPYVHGLYDKSAQWHYLDESVSEIPLEELVEQTRSDKAHFKNHDTWLTWLAARIDEYYESTVAGILGETDLNGDDHEHH